VNTSDFHREAPPVGEEVHLPGPSLIPFVCAIGITLVVIGTTLGTWLTILGVVIFLYTAIRWIRDTRRDIEELPESHAVVGHGPGPAQGRERVPAQGRERASTEGREPVSSAQGRERVSAQGRER
jgi:hypothetical protein